MNRSLILRTVSISVVFLAGCTPAEPEPSPLPTSDQSNNHLGEFVLEVDPSSGSASFRMIDTTPRGLHSQLAYAADGNPNSNPPGTIQAITTDVRGPGERGCPFDQNCFTVEVTNFTASQLFNVYMGFDAIIPPTGRDLVNPEAAPPGASAPAMGRFFGNLSPGETSAPTAVDFMVPSATPYTVRGRFWGEDGTVQSPCTGAIGVPDYQPDFTWGDESAWFPESVGAKVVVGNDLFISLSFSSGTSIYRYDTLNKTLTDLGYFGVPLVHHNGIIFARNSSGIVQYDIASGTSSVMVGTPSSIEEALVVGDTIYFVGDFTSILGFPAGHIAAWDTVTQSWDFLNGGVSGGGSRIAELNGIIYVTDSDIRTAGGVPANKIAAWDPLTRTWSSLGTSSLSDEDLDLLPYNGELVVHERGTPRTRPMIWDPVTQTWSTTTWPYFSVAFVDGGDLYVGGSRLRLINGLTINSVGLYDPGTDVATPLGSTWGVGVWNTWPLTRGVYITDIFKIGDRVFVTGGFEWGAGRLLYTPYIAQWSPTTGEWFQGLEKSGVVGDDRVGRNINSLTIAGCDLYATGHFFRTGGGLPQRRALSRRHL